ncbi:MAG: MBL fold metallo-hydrolase [Anaerolineae bacterium]|nr:MBL fold metallo-hydrolase [Anaerolineae bacterium]MCO5199157.1 MBL fold metallo-hydrolase [Anaerolineae bacterium]
MEIYPRLHWLSGGGNAYLAQDDDGFILVDTGMPGRIDIAGYLAQLGHSPTAITHILVTHADIDHVGNLAAIQRQSGATVYASPASAELLIRGESPSHGKRLMKWIIDHFMRFEPVAPEHIHVIGDGERLPILDGVQVIAAPGHTADQIVFFCKARGILFAGDALFTRNGLASSGKFLSADYEEGRRTALKLLPLSPAIFACGHGEPLQTHTDTDIMAFFNSLRDA